MNESRIMKISPLFSLFQHLFIWKPFAPTSPPFQLRMFYNCCSNDISVRNRLLEHTAWGKKYGSNRSRTYIIAVHSVCTHENNKNETHASHWCRAVLRASVRPHEAQTRIILNALFYSHALALVLYEMGCGCAILVAWYDRVSFTRETSTMHDYLNRRSLNFFDWFYCRETQYYAAYDTFDDHVHHISIGIGWENQPKTRRRIVLR